MRLICAINNVHIMSEMKKAMQLSTVLMLCSDGFPFNWFTYERAAASCTKVRRLSKFHRHTQHNTGDLNGSKEKVISHWNQLLRPAQIKMLPECWHHWLRPEESRVCCESQWVSVGVKFSPTWRKFVHNKKSLLSFYLKSRIHRAPFQKHIRW